MPRPLPYLITLLFLLVLALVYDVLEWRSQPGVGWRYLANVEYWCLVLLRWFAQFSAAGAAFYGGNKALSGDLALTFPNVLGALTISCGVAFASAFGQRQVKGEPYDWFIFGRMEQWKIRIAGEVATGKERDLVQRLESDVDWLCRNHKTAELKSRYKALLVDRRGDSAARVANGHMKQWFKESGGDVDAYKRRLGTEIAREENRGWLKRLLRMH